MFKLTIKTFDPEWSYPGPAIWNVVEEKEFKTMSCIRRK
jgi:hypothetical protein